MGEELQLCLNCKKKVSRANLTVHFVHCQRNIIPCSLCHEPVPRSRYQQHVESTHSSIECPSCGTQVDAPKIFEHQKESCSKRLVACEFCELEVPSANAAEHRNICGVRTDRCKGCTKYVQFKYLQFHYETDHKYLNPEEKAKAESEGVEGEEGEECPVCLGPVTLPLTLECGHVFCMVCVKGIANTTKNCAICRRDIQRDMLMDIRFCREEDIIKNYVNNPKYKKRSKSVPSRRVGITTEDYDNMVSALLSSRTSTSNCRYQRPLNGHTPPSYTPYCYSTSTPVTSSEPKVTASSTSTSTTTTSSSKDDDSCCCSSTSQSITPPPRRKNITPAPPRSASAAPSYSHSKPNPEEERPKRPTTLALQQSDKKSSSASPSEHSKGEVPRHLSQEEYDRWYAFQLAQAEDELSSSEFNKNQRSPFRRSKSMPERKDDFREISRGESSSDGSGSKGTQSRLPPTSPRGTSSTSSSSSSTSSSSGGVFNFASSVKGAGVLSKSSSDTSANSGICPSSGSGGSSTTGARPKSSTGLKKRVSFKEETPSVKRQAPVMLPCEFCDEVFPERDLMRHQTSCDQNETKNPREYLLSRRSSVNSPATSPSSPTPAGLTSSLNVAALSRPPTSASQNGKKTSRNSESPSKTSSRSLRTPPPHSPSPRPKINTQSSPVSPSSSSASLLQLSGEVCYSPFSSRHASISPGPGVSVSSSSGVSSGMSSINSSPVSSTPNTSSSASPIPAVPHHSSYPGTPTDIEVDFEEEEPTFSRPRKGRLISSAITSWRSISGGRSYKDHPKYARSNTAPLEFTPDEGVNSGSEITTSLSATQIHEALSQGDSDEEDRDEDPKERSQETNLPVFIRNKNKYRAPPPPPQSALKTESVTAVQKNVLEEKREYTSSEYRREISERECSEVISQKEEEQQRKIHGGFFRFDSYPVMNGKTDREDEGASPCEFCQKVLPPEKFRDHQAVCKGNEENDSHFNNHSTKREGRQDSKEPKSNAPSRHNKGPAPQPPSDSEKPKRRTLERSHSVRESSSESRRRKEFSQSSGHCLERTSSIKETSSSSRFSSRSNGDGSDPSSPRRWLSREGFYGSTLDCSAAYSGSGSLTSSTTSLNSFSGGSSSGHGWSTHVSMIRDEAARSRRTSYIYAGATSPTTPFFGATRYRERSASRHRPSSLYSSRNAFNIIAEAFAAATEKGRYLR